MKRVALVSIVLLSMVAMRGKFSEVRPVVMIRADAPIVDPSHNGGLAAAFLNSTTGETGWIVNSFDFCGTPGPESRRTIDKNETIYIRCVRGVFNRE